MQMVMTKPNDQQRYQQWYNENRAKLTHGGAWLRGSELGTAEFGVDSQGDAGSENDGDGLRHRYNDPWVSARLKTLWVRLSTYEDTGYSFTHQFLYEIARSVEGVFPDLAYLPPPKDRKVFQEAANSGVGIPATGVPWLLGTQTKRSGLEFDLICISNAIVQELINLPRFLETSGIPVFKSERMKRADLPLVILGGANALYSSVAWLEADESGVVATGAWIDGVFVGESDQAIKKILEIVRDAKEAKWSKAMTLTKLCEIDGFFVPEDLCSPLHSSPSAEGGFVKPATRKSFIWNLNEAQALESAPVYYNADALGSAHLQISEGCPCFCSFCAESWDRKPYRERNLKTLVDNALRMKASMGLDSIEIYSFNFNMHSEFYPLMWELVPYFRNIGLKSQRFDLLAHDPEMMKIQQTLGKTSLTCGLEGISPRLRNYLAKNLEQDDLHESLKTILSQKSRELKVFLIATGYEEDQDFEALGDLLEHIQGICALVGAAGTGTKGAKSGQKTGSATRIVFSMTPLVRFPWTPLEFEPAPTRTHLESIIRKTPGRVRAAGFEFRESADLPEYWTSQVLVRATHAAVPAALREASRLTGECYDREVSVRFRETLDQELRKRGLIEEALFKGTTLNDDRTQPWVRIETGVKRAYLFSRLEKCREFLAVDYCLGRSWTKARCDHCGGCPSRHHVRAIVLSTQKREYSPEQFKARFDAFRKKEREVPFEIEVGPRLRGLPRKLAGVVLARALMLTHPDLVMGYRGYLGSFWQDADKPDAPVWVEGKDVVRLLFHEETVGTLDSVDWSKVLAKTEGWITAARMVREGESVTPKRLVVKTRQNVTVSKYLAGYSLKHSLVKSAPGVKQYQLIKDSIKKGQITAITETQAQSGSPEVTLDVVLGPKFRLSEFAKLALVSEVHPNAYQYSIVAN